MSSIIELQKEEASAETEETDRLFLAIFKDPLLCCKSHLIDKSLHFFLQQSQKTFRLASEWEIKYSDVNLTVLVRLYNQQQDNYIKAVTERTKLQTSILLRMFQKNLSKNKKIFIETDSGILYFSLLINRKQISTHALDQLRNHIMSFFPLFWYFDEIISFLQPGLWIKHNQYKDENIYSKINRHRAFIKNNKNRRQSMISLLNQIQYGKRFMQVAQDQMKLYFHNIVSFHQSQMGVSHNLLEVSDLSEENEAIRKQSLGKSKGNLQKIVNGMKNLVWDSNGKKFLAEGSHCTIYTAKISYQFVDTIDIRTVNFAQKDWKKNEKSRTDDLIVKVCKNKEVLTSSNSFLNELKILQYLKEEKYPYIAKYFLQLKKQRTTSDYIYMKRYKTTLFDFLEIHSAISITNKLKFAYQIGKALCFLSAKDILHRDFKPDNIMIDNSHKVNIIDFGSCAPHYESDKFQVHDSRLLTAEICHVRWKNLKPQDKVKLQQKFDMNSYDRHRLFDVRGFGRTLCYIFFGDVVLPAIESLVNEPFHEVLENVYFIVEQCLKVDPDDRPGFSEITVFLDVLSSLVSYHNRTIKTCLDDL